MRLRRAFLSAVLLAAATVLAPVPAAAATPIVPRGSWPVYHHDDAHTGFDPSLNKVTAVTAGWVSPLMDQQVFGSPLVYGGIVYAATLNNTVYAFNQIDGSLVWSVPLRAPETDTSKWQCGTDPTQPIPQGIVGTPVIDTAASRIYVVTLSTDDIYRLEGLRLSDGFELLNTPITGPAGPAADFDFSIQQQRGALALANGYVYVPFGGRAGDCGNYHGYVFAVPTDGTAVTNYYETPGSGAGFWAAGGVVIDDSTGKVFETSGNGVASGCDDTNHNGTGAPVYENDAVVRLSKTLVHEDAFWPSDWYANWCTNDQDLGSATPVILKPGLMFQSGKWGTGFLLNPNALGGGGGELFPAGGADTGDVCGGNHAAATFASFAYAAPYVYLECNGGGISALSVNTATPSFSLCDATCGPPSWSAGGGTTFGPPIVAGGMVFAASDGGGLSAFNASTGAQTFQSAGFAVNHFVTLAEAGGQVFVASHTVPVPPAVPQAMIMSFRLYTGINPELPGPPVPPRRAPFQVPSAPPGSRSGVPQTNPNPPPPR